MSLEWAPRRGLQWSGDGWSPRTTREFLQNGRDWQAVQQFYRRVVHGTAALRDLGLASAEETLLGDTWSERIAEFQESLLKCKDEHELEYRCHERVTYRMCLSYHGTDFDGWAFNSSLHTVSGLVTEVIKQELGCEKIVLSSAGRTDKGVTSCGQVVSFFTWKCLSVKKLFDALNAAAPNGLRVWWIERVPRSFHATFSARWRRYIYLLPLKSRNDDLVDSSSREIEGIDVTRVRLLLDSLVGKKLDFCAFARDTAKKQTFDCCIHKAIVSVTSINSRKTSHVVSSGLETDCLCIEVCADRFLRRMVRVLVSTVIRESIAEGSRYGMNDPEALLKMICERDRMQTAPAAPVEGLCLAGVGYEQSHLPETCLPKL